MLGDEIDLSFLRSGRYNLILVEKKVTAGDVRLFNILNISPHEIQKLLLGEAGCIERLQNRLLVLLIQQFDAVVDHGESLQRASVFCTRHKDLDQDLLPETCKLATLQKSNMTRVVVDKLEEMITNGGQV